MFIGIAAYIVNNVMSWNNMFVAYNRVFQYITISQTRVYTNWNMYILCNTVLDICKFRNNAETILCIHIGTCLINRLYQIICCVKLNIALQYYIKSNQIHT